MTLRDHLDDPVWPATREPVDVRAAEQHRVGAERERGEDVGAGADAAVEQHGRLVARRRRARPTSASSEAIELSTWRPPWLDTIDRVDAVVEGAARVVGVQDPLEHDGQPGALAQRGQVVPATGRGWSRCRGRSRPPRAAPASGGCPRNRPGWLRVIESSVRIAPRVTSTSLPRPAVPPRCARATSSRKRGSEVYCAMPRPCANGSEPRSRSCGRQPERGGVERDDQRPGADRLGPLDQAVDELLVGAPVELVPPRLVAHRRGATPPSGCRPGW